MYTKPTRQALLTVIQPCIGAQSKLRLFNADPCPRSPQISNPIIIRFQTPRKTPSQHNFCALWNEIAREAHNFESSEICDHVHFPARHLYIALHQDADAAITSFDASTVFYDTVVAIIVPTVQHPRSSSSCHHVTYCLPPDAVLKTTTTSAGSGVSPSANQNLGPGIATYIVQTSRHQMVRLRPSESPSLPGIESHQFFYYFT